MDWWKRVMPIEGQGGASQQIRYRGKNATIATAESGPDPDREDRVMLVRPRRSRIYYLGQFFDYPISLSPDTLRKLGMIRLVKIGTSYVWATLFPYRKPRHRSLSNFFIRSTARGICGRRSRMILKPMEEKFSLSMNSWGLRRRRIVLPEES